MLREKTNSWSAPQKIVDVRRQVSEKLRVPVHQVQLLDSTGIAFKDNDDLNRMIEGAEGPTVAPCNHSPKGSPKE